MVDIPKGAKKLLHLRCSSLVIDVGNEELAGVVHWGYWGVGSGHGVFSIISCLLEGIVAVGCAVGR